MTDHHHENPPPNIGTSSLDITCLFTQLSEFIKNALAHSRAEIENMMNRNRADMEALIAYKLDDSMNQDKEYESSDNRDGHGVLNPPKSDKVSFTSFKKSGTTEFDGVVDPNKAFEWLKNTEKMFRICACRKVDKVTYATTMLVGPALHWQDDTFSSMMEEC